MNKNTDRNIEIKAPIKEVYFYYDEHPDNKIGSRILLIASWFSKQINAHFDRLSALRVYDHRRVIDQKNISGLKKELRT